MSFGILICIPVISRHEEKHFLENERLHLEDTMLARTDSCLFLATNYLRTKYSTVVPEIRYKYHHAEEIHVRVRNK